VLLAIAPFVLSSYLVSQLVFVCIYATVGVGLMMLAGFTGQARSATPPFFASAPIPGLSAGNTACRSRCISWPPACLTGIVGAMVGFPALRLQGIYLVIATISFAFIVEEVLARWESVTGTATRACGSRPSRCSARPARDSPASTSSASAADPDHLGRSICCARRPAAPSSRSATARLGAQHGHQRLALQDVVRHQAALTGVCGALFAHKLSFISPGNVHAAALDRVHHRDPDRRHVQPARRGARRDLPGHDRGVPDLSQGRHARHRDRQAPRFGASKGRGQRRRLCLRQRPEGRDLRHHRAFVLFEPLGLYGRWLKIKLFFQLFPLYKRATFKRQKIYVKSERNR
jgi:branched-chain amino acid transport system permease protein